MDRGTWRATVHGSQRVNTTQQLNHCHLSATLSKSDKKVRFPISSITDIGREQERTRKHCGEAVWKP